MYITNRNSVFFPGKMPSTINGRSSKDCFFTKTIEPNNKPKLAVFFYMNLSIKMMLDAVKTLKLISNIFFLKKKHSISTALPNTQKQQIQSDLLLFPFIWN